MTPFVKVKFVRTAADVLTPVVQTQIRMQKFAQIVIKTVQTDADCHVVIHVSVLMMVQVVVTGDGHALIVKDVEPTACRVQAVYALRIAVQSVIRYAVKQIVTIHLNARIVAGVMKLTTVDRAQMVNAKENAALYADVL